MPKFLRRDPTAWLTILQVAIALALTWHPFGITADFIPLYMAALNAAAGIVTAILTKRTGFSFAIGLLQAAIALMAGYGISLTDEQTNTAIFLATLILGLFNWQNNSPAEVPGLHEEPMPQPTVVNQTIVSSNRTLGEALDDPNDDRVVWPAEEPPSLG